MDFTHAVSSTDQYGFSRRGNEICSSDFLQQRVETPIDKNLPDFSSVLKDSWQYESADQLCSHQCTTLSRAV